MKLWQRRPKNRAESVPDLILPMGDGTPVFKFPGAVINSLRYMTTRIVRAGNFPPRLAMVAALRQEGVTYITRALATTLAHDTTDKICIVDLNWWWPAPSDLAAADNPGLAGVITGAASLDDIIAPSGWSNLALAPAGEMQPQHRPVMARSNALREVIDDLSTRFDHLILDIPAVQATNDAIPLASLGDACCVVIRQGVTTMEDTRLALDEINHLQILGVVMNRVKLKTPNAILKYIPTR